MGQNCRICLGQHDDEVHAATERVHEWLREQVELVLHAASQDAASEAGDTAARKRDAA